jgi:integrase
MQIWPKNHIKRSPELRDVALTEWPIAEIIGANREFKYEGISRKTLEDSYVAFVRAIIRDRRTELGFADPFRDMKIAWPLSSTSPRKRLPISTPTLNKVFVYGVESGYLEEAVLPLMAYLTGRRIGLLLHLRGEDFRQRDGVWIAHPQSHIRFEGKRIRVPYKTEASLRPFVLHNVLDEIGFSMWASEQKGPVFANALRYPDPSKLASRRLNRLLQRSGAIGENIEVLHSLRHQAIDRMRHAKLDDKSRLISPLRLVQFEC